MRVIIILNETRYEVEFIDEELQFNYIMQEKWKIQGQYWDNNHDMNVMMLKHVENWCYDMIQRHGFISMNELLRCFGIPRSRVGQVYGWVNLNEVNLNIINGDGFFNKGTNSCLMEFNVTRIF